MRIPRKIKYDAPEFEISSLTDLFIFLRDCAPKKGFFNFYRGHGSSEYTLQPSALRDMRLYRAENTAHRELVSLKPHEFLNDRSAFDRLVRMQHYGFPTQLLDVTYNPLVALYFCCDRALDAASSQADGEFVLVTSSNKDVKYYDSDTVSIISNISNLKSHERNVIRKMSSSEQLREHEYGLRLLHFIKSEKSYFLPKINIDDLRRICFVRPKYTNDRLIAQQGVFLLFGFSWYLDAEGDETFSVRRARVPAASKNDILRELNQININRFTLFPELPSAAGYLKRRFATDD